LHKNSVETAIYNGYCESFHCVHV